MARRRASRRWVPRFAVRRALVLWGGFSFDLRLVCRRSEWTRSERFATTEDAAMFRHTPVLPKYGHLFGFLLYTSC